MPTNEKNARYHADHHADLYALAHASDQDLAKWGADPNCVEMEACANALAERLAQRKRDQTEYSAFRTAKREELLDNPFDPRMEISADAKYIARKIVTHLWILFVLLPVGHLGRLSCAERWIDLRIAARVENAALDLSGSRPLVRRQS